MDTQKMKLDFQKLRDVGLNLIPCKPKSKEPKVNWKQFETVKFTGDVGNDNAAVICGVTSGNLVVIDIDKPEYLPRFFNDFEGIKQNTLVVQTGSGIHVYVKPKGNLPPIMPLFDEKGEHVGEVRGQGGYVISPGSIHPNGKEYEIISSVVKVNEVDLDSLLEHLRIGGIAPKSKGLPISELMTNVPVGNRNNAAFKYTAHLISNLNLPDDMIWAELKRWSAQLEFKCPESELRNVFKSALKRVKRPEPEEGLIRFRDIGAEFEGEEISFECMVIAVDELKSVSKVIHVKCHKCGHEEDVDGNGFVNPKVPKCDECKINMTLLRAEETNDMRQVILQDLPEQMKNNTPHRLNGRVINHNVNLVKMGDRVKLKAKYKSIVEAGDMDNQVVLLISDVQPIGEAEETELTIEEVEQLKNEPELMKKLVSSFCPNIRGRDDAKEIILLSLAGGVKTGVVSRTIIHTLLIGNSEEGKTQLIEFVTKIAPKSSYVNGKSATGVGLVFSMVKLPDGTSVPSPGLMVLNSGGYVGLDEFDKMSEGAQFELLQCMEEESANLNKSGAVNTTAPAKTTVIAGANPQLGRWDKTKTILENVGMKDSVISRFDWLAGFLELDDVTEEAITNYTVNSIVKGAKVEKPFFDELQYRHYINTVRRLQPEFSEEAGKRIIEFRNRMKQKLSDGKNIPLGKRHLHAIIRASAARAKLHLREMVQEADVEAIINLYKKSYSSLGLEVTDDVVQMLLEDPAANKEQCILSAWHSAEDLQHLVDKNQFFEILQSQYSKFFKNVFDCQNMFQQHEGKRFLLQPNGKYRLSL